MTHAAPPVFGKRGASPRATTPVRSLPTPAPTPAIAADAFFAAVREETREPARPSIVPRSFGAALLAGLVVGFALAGLDITHADATLHRLAGQTGVETQKWLPVMILAALAGGARAAATSLLIAHAALKRLALTSHVAYAVAGGLVAAAFSAGAAALAQAGLLDAGLLPGHGLAVDAGAGAAAGALYRMFAGARPV